MKRMIFVTLVMLGAAAPAAAQTETQQQAPPAPILPHLPKDSRPASLADATLVSPIALMDSYTACVASFVELGDELKSAKADCKDSQEAATKLAARLGESTRKQKGNTYVVGDTGFSHGTYGRVNSYGGGGCVFTCGGGVFTDGGGGGNVKTYNSSNTPTHREQAVADQRQPTEGGVFTGSAARRRQ